MASYQYVYFYGTASQDLSGGKGFFEKIG